MKKVLLILWISLMAIDPSFAQLAFERPTPQAEGQEFIPTDVDDFAKKRRKKKKRKSKGKATEMGLVASPQLSLAIPMGEMGDAVNMGFGGGLDASYSIMPEVLVGLSTGFHQFAYKKLEEEGFTFSGTHSYIPILAQGTYLFGTDMLRPYAGIGLGLFMGSSYIENGMLVKIGNEPGTGAPVYETIYEKTLHKASNFGVSPIAGVFYALSDNILLNANLRFNAIFTTKEELQEDFTIKEVPSMDSYLLINIGVAITFGN